TVETDLYTIVLSNHGAVVHSWILKKYRDSNVGQFKASRGVPGTPLELVNFAAAPEVGYPFALVFKSQTPHADVNKALYATKTAPDGLEVSFEYSDGKTFARKIFHFAKDSYLTQVTTEVTEGGAPIPHLIAWRGGFGDMSVPSPAAAQHAIHYDDAAQKLN